MQISLKFLKITQILCLLAILLCGLLIAQQYSEYKTNFEICTVNGLELQKGSTIMGIYSTEEFYCVNVKGLNNEEIATTEVHEQCHALIYNDKEHFCEE